MKPALSALSPRGNKGKQFKARKERVIPGEATNNASEMRSIDLYEVHPPKGAEGGVA